MRICCSVLVLVFVVAQFPAVAQDAKALKAAAMQAEVMKKIMAKFDLNGDGEVDDEEKAKVVDQISKDFNAGNVPEGFKEFVDRNRNGKVEAAEAAAFQAIVGRLQGGGGPPQFGAAGGGPGQPGFGGPGFGGPGFGGPGFGGPGGDAFSGQVPPEVLKKFNKNKNGQLDESEQKAAMAAFGPKKSRKEQLLEKLDLNGDGKVTKEEREQVAAQRKAEQEEKKAEAAEERKAKAKKKDEKTDKSDDDEEK